MNNDSQIMSLAYAYDSLNRLISVSDGTDTASYTYDANSNELTASLNGEVYKSTQYNLANLPTRVNFPNTGDDTNRIEYTYRVNGNMHSHRDWLDYTAARIYNYDGAGRLIMDLSALEDENYTDRFTYDTRGNISSVEHTDRSVSPNVKTTTTYTYDRANRLLSSTDGTDTTVYSYDGIGNMTSVVKNGEQIKSYSYDNFNRLSSSTVNGVSTAYTYDGDNLRQTNTTDGVTTQHILDGMNVVADIKNNDINTYTRGNGLVFSKNLTTGNRTVYNTHTKGDVAQLVQPDGSFTEYTYTAYGKIKYNTTDNTNPFTYCGEYTDTETGLVYLRNRYYDPELGIFLTQDPAMDGFNWYAYCAGDPVNSVDPYGLDDVTVQKIQYLLNLKLNYEKFNIPVDVAAAQGDKYRQEIMKSPMMEKVYFRTLVEDAFGDGKQGSIEQVNNLLYVANANTALEKIAANEDETLTMAQHNWVHSSDAIQNSCIYQISVKDMNDVCFVAGTKILTIDGEKNIEEIVVGDYVYSKSEVTGEQGYKQVTKTFENHSCKIINLNISNSTIKVTPSHLFWVENAGWVSAENLKKGVKLQLKDNSFARIDNVNIDYLIQDIIVYNFEVEDWHTYYVSDLNIWVHNKCEPGNALVYFGRNENGINIYVGITNDITVRERQHGERFQGGLIPITSSIPRFKARSIEQGLIEKNPQFENKINSISPKNRLYPTGQNIYQQWDEEQRKRNGGK